MSTARAAQPLLVSNFTMPDNSVHNILIVATGHNTVYAYDAQTYTIFWRRNLGAPQSSGDVAATTSFRNMEFRPHR